MVSGLADSFTFICRDLWPIQWRQCIENYFLTAMCLSRNKVPGKFTDLALGSFDWSYCQQKKLVPVRTVHSEVCGLSRVTSPVFLNSHCYWIFQMLFVNALVMKFSFTSNVLASQGVVAEVEISKPQSQLSMPTHKGGVKVKVVDGFSWRQPKFTSCHRSAINVCDWSFANHNQVLFLV